MRKLIIGITVATTLALSPGAALAQAMVMDVGLEVDTSYMRQRDCPVTLTFHGEIRTSGAGSVTYRIIRSDGSSGPIRSLEFKRAETRRFDETWTLGDASTRRIYEGWMAVRVLTPNQMESPHADFILTCGTVSTAPPQRGRFRISLTGFTCNRQTRDHFVEADGPADEIYQVPFVVAVERSGSTVLIPSRPGSPVGSHGPIFREIRSGASFPRTPCVLSPAPSRSGVPGVLFEGELIAGQKAVVIYPTLWEFDDDPVQLVVFQGACLAARNRVAAAAIPIMTSEIPRVRLSRTLSIVADRPLISVNIQREGDLDRPIGLEFGRDVPLHEVGDPIVVTATEPPPGSTIFRPRDLVFTYERAAADSTSGTPITIPYVDPRSHEGDYSLCIMVQRL